MSQAHDTTIIEGELLPPGTPFDYGQLDPESRIVIQQKTTEIKERMRRAAQDIVDIGQRLLEVKARLPHGQFGDWLATEFTWSEATAGRYMSVAKTMPQIPHGADFESKALYILASPATPAEARAEALERAAAGEKITNQAAAAIVAQHRPAPPVQRQPEARRSLPSPAAIPPPAPSAPALGLPTTRLEIPAPSTGLPDRLEIFPQVLPQRLELAPAPLVVATASDDDAMEEIGSVAQAHPAAVDAFEQDFHTLQRILVSWTAAATSPSVRAQLTGYTDRILAAVETLAEALQD